MTDKIKPQNESSGQAGAADVTFGRPTVAEPTSNTTIHTALVEAGLVSARPTVAGNSGTACNATLLRAFDSVDMGQAEWIRLPSPRARCRLTGFSRTGLNELIEAKPASDDTEDARVVFTPAKNNDGELGARTAWARKAGWFEPVTDFDLEEFDGASGAHREPKVNEGHLRDIFENGRRWCALKVAAEALQERAEVGRSAAYDALKVIGGRFSNLLARNDDGLIGLRVALPADDGEPV